MPWRIPLVLLFAVLCMMPVRAGAQTRPRIAVLELKGTLPRGQLSVMSDKVREGVLRSMGRQDYVVMSRENMAMLLRDMGLDCESAEGECEVETGRNIGAAYVVSGSVEDVGGGLWLASVKVHDTETGALLATGDVRGKQAIELIDQLPATVMHVMARAFGEEAQGAVQPAPAVGNTPAQAQMNLDFGGSAGGLGVEAKLKAQECSRQAEQKGSRARASTLAEAISQAQDQASQAWRAQLSELQMCTQLNREDRNGCIQAVEQWLGGARSMKVELPAGVETVLTDCGARQPAYEAEVKTVAAKEVKDAESLLTKLKAVDPQVRSGGGLGSLSQGAPQEGVLEYEEALLETQSDSYRQKAREKRHQSMNFLQDILANRSPSGAQKAEMMLRLADLYFEEGRDLYLTEKSQGQTHTASRKWQEKSIRIYQVILKSFPQYQRADEATFFLGSAMWDTGQSAAAVKEFTRLVRTYPQSRYIPDAYVMLGEYYFEHNNAYKALLAYQKATKFKKSAKWGFAMYKLAWCYYNVGEYGKAIDTMKSVVAWAGADQGRSKSKTGGRILSSALENLVRFFRSAGERDEGVLYFRRLGKTDLEEQVRTGR